MKLSILSTFTTLLFLTSVISHFKTTAIEANMQNKTDGRINDTSSVATSTRKPKFGLAWLFANTGRRERTNASKRKTAKDLKKQRTIDKRIEPTKLELEGSIGESRVSVVSSDVKLWENHTDGKPCTSQNLMNPDISRLEAQEGDTIALKCILHDVHHEVDFDKFQVVWAISEWPEKGNDVQGDRNNDNRHSTVKKNKKRGAQSCREKRNENKKELPKSDIQYNSHRILSTYRPKCRLYTEFPFDDLTTVTKDITCTTQMTLSPATINDTGVYICKSKIAFKSIGANQQNATKDSGTNNTIVNIDVYELTGSLMLRVVRRRGEDDYRIHRIVSLVIGTGLLILFVALMGKKLSKKRLGWESKMDNYTPEWTRGIPVRKIASAGSLTSWKSKSNIRLASESCIKEESDEDDMITDNRSDSNASFGFDPSRENNISESKSYEGIHMAVTPNSSPKPAVATNASTGCPPDNSISVKKPFTKPKTILKNSRRCSTPDLTSI